MKVRARWVDSPRLKNRFVALSIVAVAIFGILLLRLWYLQIISVDQYRQLSEKNRIRYLPVAAERGPIYDRDGELLVDSRPGFTIAALRQEVEESETLLTQLALYLQLDREEMKERWLAGQRLPRYRPVVLAADVGRDGVERVQENAIDLPGVLTLVTPIRAFPYQDLGAHLFGYLGEITEEELRSGQYDSYRGGEFIGKNGIERFLEPYLRGQEGERLLEVDVKGKELRTLKTLEPLPGQKVFLTLRKDIQLAAEQAIGEQAGAAVALDVSTGEILALVSKPTFDPALFARGINEEEWIELLQDSRHPLQNRALRGQYPPGSTFKLVTALAALESGKIGSEHTVDCTGRIEIGPREFRCWKKKGHGTTGLKKAIRESCDVWFYDVSLKIGIDQIADTARQLGLGSGSGYAAATERSGLIPDVAWKKRRFNDRWYEGETVIAAIGQGFVLTTPMQLAIMTAAIANGGKVLQPHIVARVEDYEGNALYETAPVVRQVAEIKPKHLNLLKAGLEAVVNEKGGTGWASHLSGIRVAGKTGTAQVVRMKSDEEEEKIKDEDIEYRFRDHALFVSYAPAEAPEIAIAVVIEHGSHGSTAAAPVSKAILEAYFADVLPKTGPTPVPAIAVEENE